MRGQQIAPFRHYDGRVHFHAVFEGDGEFRGIGDNDRRALHILQHAAAPGLALQAADALLDRGMPFHLLKLILLILAAHLQFVFMALALEEIIRPGPYQEHQRTFPRHLIHPPHGKGHQCGAAAMQQGGKEAEVPHQRCDREVDHHGSRQQRLQQAAQGGEGKQLLNVAHGIEALPVRRQRRGSEHQSALSQSARRAYYPTHDGGHGHAAKYRPGIAPDRDQLIGMACRQFQLLAQHAAPIVRERRHLRGQKQHCGHRSQAGRQIPAACDLALLARLLAPARRCFLGLALVGHGCSAPLSHFDDFISPALLSASGGIGVRPRQPERARCSRCSAMRRACANC